MIEHSKSKIRQFLPMSFLSKSYRVKHVHHVLRVLHVHHVLRVLHVHHVLRVCYTCITSYVCYTMHDPSFDPVGRSLSPVSLGDFLRKKVFSRNPEMAVKGKGSSLDRPEPFSCCFLTARRRGYTP